MDSRDQTCRRRVRETFLLRDCPEETVERVLNDPRALCREAAKGEVIYDPRHFQRCLGIVLEGSIQVNKGALIMSLLRPGDLFGAAALFNQQQDYATTLTARSRCRLLLLPQTMVEELMAQYPQVGRNYVAYLSQRICFLSGKIDALTAGSAGRKLGQYLLAHARGDEVCLECSASGLAARLGVSRASLYRALEGLSQSGMVDRQGRQIRILDREALERYE